MGKPSLRRAPKVAPRTIIGRHICPGCGRETPLRVQGNNLVSLSCDQLHPDSQYHQCGGFIRWGAYDSDTFIIEFLEKADDGGPTDTDKTENRAGDEAGDDNGNAAGDDAGDTRAKPGKRAAEFLE